jgi:hypothetical protein
VSTSTLVDVFDQYGNLAATLNVLQGSTVTDDRTQAVRRQASLKVADPTGALSPSSGTSLLSTGSTSGNVIKVSSYGVPLGTFVSKLSATEDSGAQRTVSLTGQDLSWLISRPQIDTAWVVGAGTSWGSVFADFIDEYQPTADLSNLANIGWPSPAITVNPGEQPWSAMATQWAPAVGYELFYGPDNKVYLSLVPDPRTQLPVATLSEGPDCIFTTVDHSFTDDSCPNVFQRDGVGPANNVVSSVALDDNPASSTYVGSGYGYVKDYRQDTLVYSQAQADNAAQCALFLGLGANQPVVLDLVPGPQTVALKVSQMVVVTRAKAGLNAARVVIDTIAHSFYPGDTTLVTGRAVAAYG